MKSKNGPAGTGPNVSFRKNEDNNSSARSQGVTLRFERRKEGVFWGSGDIQADMHFLCNPINVLGFERDGQNAGWCYCIEAVDDDGKVRVLLVPRSMLAKPDTDLLSLFLDHGISAAFDARSRKWSVLKQFIARTTPDTRVRRVQRIGWHGDGFLLGSQYFEAPSDEKLRLVGDVASSVKISARGSLADWKINVATPLRGNSRLVFAVALAFAGPIAGMLSEESGGFNLYGKTSMGKTTAAYVACSVAGDPADLKLTWRMTSNGAEAISAAHNDMLLILDELQQTTPDQAVETVYMFNGGKGKTRMSRDTSLRQSYAWRVLFLSTGEIDFAGFVRASKKGARGGQLVRAVDIPADAGKGLGLFESIGSSESADAFARALKDATSNYYGTPIVAFLDMLTKSKVESTDKAKLLMAEFQALF